MRIKFIKINNEFIIIRKVYKEDKRSVKIYKKFIKDKEYRVKV
jgi:hypothetical protein